MQRAAWLACALLTPWTPGHAASDASTQRVIALAPHIVELVYAAGAQAQLAAVVDGSDFPQDARQLPRLGDGTRLSIERVLGLRPDLVLAWQAAPVRSLLPWLDRHGIDVEYVDPLTLDAVPDAVDLMGIRLGTAEIARPRAAELRRRIAVLRERYASEAPVRVFIQLGTSPMFSLGASSIVTDALRVCGGVNVMADTALAAPRTSIEGALATQPDAILTGDPQAGIRAFWQRTGWPADGRADDRIVALSADALYRPGPRLIDATERLCERLAAIRRLSQPAAL